MSKMVCIGSGKIIQQGGGHYSKMDLETYQIWDAQIYGCVHLLLAAPLPYNALHFY